MKIGLLGGSFDPPHFGHIGISKEALELLNLDEIWWLPTKQNPLKETKTSNFDKRLALCEEICQKEGKIIVKDTEKTIKSSYFIDLLNKIIKNSEKTTKNREFYLLIGSDNLKNFHLWHKWQEIIDKLAKIVVFERESGEGDQKSSKFIDFCPKNKIIFLKNKKFNISSTELRNKNA